MEMSGREGVRVGKTLDDLYELVGRLAERMEQRFEEQGERLQRLEERQEKVEEQLQQQGQQLQKHDKRLDRLDTMMNRMEELHADLILKVAYTNQRVDQIFDELKEIRAELRGDQDKLAFLDRKVWEHERQIYLLKEKLANYEKS